MSQVQIEELLFQYSIEINRVGLAVMESTRGLVNFQYSIEINAVLSNEDKIREVVNFQYSIEINRCVCFYFGF